MNFDIDEINGACHCKRVKFQVKLADGLRSARRCTCSYCRMRGAIAVSASLDGLKLLEGEDALGAYQFNTGTVKHYFCASCGIYTHHQRRSNPHQYGVNVACLENLSPFDFAEVPVLNGVAHPSDTNAPVEVVGVLRFIPTS